MKLSLPKLRTVLSQPVVGFAPWILLAVAEGPHRVALAAGLACALAVLTCAAGTIVGLRPKLLDITAITFFGALALTAMLASPAAGRWLGTWSGELSTAVIAAVAALSLAARRPFTLQYARESTDRAYWTTPLFLRINYVLTAVWAVAFLLTAITGYLGDGPLHQPGNSWTNWIIQIALVVLAATFTAWYPDHATAGPAAGAGPAQPLGHLFRPLAAYCIVAGIIALLIGGTPWPAGAALIIIGLAARRALRSSAAGHSAAAAPPPGSTAMADIHQPS
jgi:hypothetical protein